MPIVAELPTFQNTLQGEAPLINTTLLFDAVVSVESIWKMNTADGSPCALSVNVPGQLGGTDPVDPGVERGAAELRGQVGERGPAGGVVEGGGQVALGLQRDRVAEVDLAADGPGGKPGRGASRDAPEALGQEAGAGVGAVAPARTEKLPAVPRFTGASARWRRSS